MNLVSCASCGVVLDKNKISFPDIDCLYLSGDCRDAAWNGRDWTAKVPCPVCRGDILEEEK